MLTTEARIKAALVHPEEEIRLAALAYYARSFSQDPGLMPLVIEAIERYGRQAAGFRLLREAEQLPQTAPTVRWLVDELSQPWDLSDPANDNYCFAAAMLLANSPPNLLSPQFAELPCFPEELRGFVHQRLEMVDWDWQTGWNALEDLIREVGDDDFQLPQVHRAQRIVESLARHRHQAPRVLQFLQDRCEDEDSEISPYLEPFVVEIAGRMRLEEAVPHLIDRLDDAFLDLTEACTIALHQIGGSRTVQLIAQAWPDADEDFRMTAAEVLEHIHAEPSLETCLQLFTAEEDYEVTFFLAHALLGQIAPEAIEPVRTILQEDPNEEDEEQRDLVHRLVAVATILGVDFPGYDAWFREAKEDDWGWGDRQEPRVRNSIRRQYGLPPIDESEEDWQDELSPEEEQEFAHLWKRIRETRPEMLEEVLNMNTAELGEPEPVRPPTVEPIHRESAKIGRNDPCPCGSGKKYKQCCLHRQ